MKQDLNTSDFLEGAAAVLIAAAITGVTAVLPMVASVGRLVYANNIPVMLMSMKFGPIGRCV